MTAEGKRALRALAAVAIPGALIALAWTERAAVMTAVGTVWRSAYAGNFGGKRTVPVDQIVIHSTEGTKASAISWFAQDHTKWGKGPSSAHYVIGQDGTITQMVAEDAVAWHAGNRAVNARSIGIECEGFAADADTWSPALIDSLCALVAQLAAKYRVPVKHGTAAEPGIIGHVDVPNQTHTDPGPYFPWADVIAQINARLRGIA